MEPKFSRSLLLGTQLICPKLLVAVINYPKKDAIKLRMHLRRENPLVRSRGDALGVCVTGSARTCRLVGKRRNRSKQMNNLVENVGLLVESNTGSSDRTAMNEQKVVVASDSRE